MSRHFRFQKVLLASALLLSTVFQLKGQTFSLTQLKYTSSGYNSIYGGWLNKLNENSFVSLRDGNKEMSVDVFDLGSEDPSNSFMIDKKEGGDEKLNCKIHAIGNDLLFSYSTFNKIADRAIYWAEIRRQNGSVLHKSKEVARESAGSTSFNIIQSPDRSKTMLYFEPTVAQVFVVRAIKPEFNIYNISEDLNISSELLVHGIKNLSPETFFLSDQGTLSFLWYKTATNDDERRNGNLKDNSTYGIIIHKAGKTSHLKVADLNNCTSVKAIRLENGKIAVYGIYRKDGQAKGSDHILYFEYDPETGKTDQEMHLPMSSAHIEQMLRTNADSEKDLKKIDKKLENKEGLLYTDVVGIQKINEELRLCVESHATQSGQGVVYSLYNQLSEFVITEGKIDALNSIPKLQWGSMTEFMGAVKIGDWFLINANSEFKTVGEDEKFVYANVSKTLCLIAVSAENTSIKNEKLLCMEKPLLMVVSTALVFDNKHVVVYLSNVKSFDNALITLSLE